MPKKKVYHNSHLEPRSKERNTESRSQEKCKLCSPDGFVCGPCKGKVLEIEVVKVRRSGLHNLTYMIATRRCSDTGAQDLLTHERSAGE